jgi:uncharacterized GH25 family protein
MKYNPLKFTCGALLSFASVIAQAHDVALIPEPDGSLTVRYGHPGDLQPTDRERLLGIMVFQGTKPGAALSLPLEKKDLTFKTNTSVIPDGKVALFAARYDNGL